MLHTFSEVINHTLQTYILTSFAERLNESFLKRQNKRGEKIQLY